MIHLVHLVHCRLSIVLFCGFFYSIEMTTDHPILTVSQLSQAIKLSLESTFPSIMLQGEISNCTSHTSGHLYFSLKDAHAQISAIMFRPDAASLKMAPKNGMQVIVKGELSVYPANGKYQVVVRELRPVGIGELLLKLEELKAKILKKGWFRKEHKKPLPMFPKRIGVVTSPTGAVIQDILNILSRRFSGFHLILNPVKVQGEGAAQEIARAIDQFNRYDLADVLIVGRGGGSMEDLWAFNEEIVAEAIFNSRIPIISAVGHETDHCIADYVADVRAPTPSAAAEIVIAEQSQQLSHLAQLQKRMQQTVMHFIKQDRHRLTGLLRHPILSSPYGILGPWLQKLDTLQQNMDETVLQHVKTLKLILNSRRQLLLSLQPAAKLSHFRQKLTVFDRQLNVSILRKFQMLKTALNHVSTGIDQTWCIRQANRRDQFQIRQKFRLLDDGWERMLLLKKERLRNLKNSLDAVNPKNLLTKGYCILFSEKDHSAITSVRSIQKDQQVQILLSDGDLKATINEIVQT